MHRTLLTRYVSLLTATGALALALLPATSSRAAIVSWSTPTLISADTNVSTTGSLVYAYKMSASGVTSAAVNGVTFAPFAVPNTTSNPVTVGSVTLAVDSGDTFRSSNTAAGSTSTPFTTLSTAYQGLLQSAVATPGSATTDLLTLTLGGLTIGNNYLVQFWVNDSGPGLSDGLFKTVLSSGNAVTLAYNTTFGGGGVGQWVTGTFAANAPTQVVTFAPSFPGLDPAIVNAFEVRLVPEPSSALLLVSAGLSLLAFRRRG